MPRQAKAKPAGTKDAPTFYKLVRDYLVEEEYSPALDGYDYTIRVGKIDRRSGRYDTIAGLSYNALKGVKENLGEDLGTGTYRLYVTGVNQNTGIETYAGKFDGIGIIDANDPGEIEGEEPQPGQPRPGPSIDAATLQMQMQRERFAHEMQLKAMENNNTMMLALINAKGGGGVGTKDIMAILNTGVKLGQGLPVTEGGEESAGFDWSSLVTMAPQLLSMLPNGGPNPAPNSNATPPQAPPPMQTAPAEGLAQKD